MKQPSGKSSIGTVMFVFVRATPSPHHQRGYTPDLGRSKRRKHKPSGITYLAVHPKPAHAVRRNLERQVAPQNMIRKVRPSPVPRNARPASQAGEERRTDVGQAPQELASCRASSARAVYPCPSRLVVRRERVHEGENLAWGKLG